jgi:hypothetical protein
MKMIVFAGMLVLLLGSALLIGCSQPAPAAPIPAAVTTAPADNGTAPAPAAPGVKTAHIGDILQDPKVFDGKTVLVEGKISRECPSGCWFTLKDGNAEIYIDLNPSGMVIPQKTGSYAKVTAEVINEGGDVYLVGKKVDF